jgi:polyisoprenoid-binding protein YceI
LKFKKEQQIMMKLDCFSGIRNLLAVGVLLLAVSLEAQNTIRYDAQPGGKVRVEGTSSLHDWAVESRVLGGFMELEPGFDADLKTLTTTPKVEVTIPVRQLKSTDNSKKMDANTWEHLSYTNHPAIKYRLLSLTPKAGGSAGPASQFEAKGELTVAGVTRTNTMPISMERVDKTKIKVTGKTSLKMTDFGIQPPTIAILFVKTGDDVKVSFEWLTAKSEKTADAK